MRSYKKVLSIAGSDSGGGAGIQADIKTISSLECIATTAITAITSQNTIGIQGIYPVDPVFVEMQIESILSDIGTDAVKIGMLHSKELIRTISLVLKKYDVCNIVIDPVISSTSGSELLKNDSLDDLIKYLMPISALITPNKKEAEEILKLSICEKSDYEFACEEFVRLGASNVLIKGGDEGGDYSVDCLYIGETREFLWPKAKRIESKNTHGTGCTLSSAIASFLAKGYDIKTSVLKGKNYITKAIEGSRDYNIGRGHGPVKHFFEYWK